MPYFIFNNTWILIEHIFKYFGVHPIKRISRFELGSTNACQYWLRYFVALLVAFLMLTSVPFIIIYVENIPMVPRNLRFMTSPIYSKCLYGSILLGVAIHVILIIKLRSTGKIMLDVVEIQKYCNNCLIIDSYMKKKLLKKLYGFMIPIFFLFIGEYNPENIFSIENLNYKSLQLNFVKL